MLEVDQHINVSYTCKPCYYLLNMILHINYRILNLMLHINYKIYKFFYNV